MGGGWRKRERSRRDEEEEEEEGTHRPRGYCQLGGRTIRGPSASDPSPLPMGATAPFSPSSLDVLPTSCLKSRPASRS